MTSALLGRSGSRRRYSDRYLHRTDDDSRCPDGVNAPNNLAVGTSTAGRGLLAQGLIDPTSGVDLLQPRGESGSDWRTFGSPNRSSLTPKGLGIQAPAARRIA